MRFISALATTMAALTFALTSGVIAHQPLFCIDSSNSACLSIDDFGQNVSFELVVKNGSIAWFGFGFGSSMTNTEVYIIWPDVGTDTVQVSHRYASSSSNALPLYCDANFQDATIENYYTDFPFGEFWNVTFTRSKTSLITASSSSSPITSDLTTMTGDMIWAWSGVEPKDMTTCADVKKHTDKGVASNVTLAQFLAPVSSSFTSSASTVSPTTSSTTDSTTTTTSSTTDNTTTDTTTTTTDPTTTTTDPTTTNTNSATTTADSSATTTDDLATATTESTTVTTRSATDPSSSNAASTATSVVASSAPATRPSATNGVSLNQTTGATTVDQNSYKATALKVHGVLMMMAWFIMAPLAIMTTRYWKSTLKKHWRKMHMILTFGGVLLLNFVSLLIVMSVQGVQNISAGAHESLGITIVVCLLLQALFGLANDRLHGTSSPLNKLVRFVHMWFGRLITVAAWINVPLGMATFINFGYQISFIMYIMFVAWSMFVLIAFVLLELRRYPTDTKKSGATSVKGIFKRQPEDIHLVERLDNKFLPYEEFL